jgi:hypothetical protein
LGKLGAIISQVGFFQLKDLNGVKNSGIPLINEILFGFMVVGFALTFLLPETKGKTLEEINGENEMDSTDVETKTSDSQIHEEIDEFGNVVTKI